MIMIDPSNKPVFLSSPQIVAALERIRKRINSNQLPAINKSEELWRNEEITDELYDSHHGKCCYCERKRDRKREMDVEHYRPKSEVKNDDDHTGYWWLVFDWNNLLWSCKICNQKYKDTIFELLPGSTRAINEASDITLEKPCLINPKLEDPLELISFHVDFSGGRYFISVVPRAGLSIEDETRAKETIRIVGLNRKEAGYDLVLERGNDFLSAEFEGIVITILASEKAKNYVPEKRQVYLDIINESREKLKKFVKSERIFAGFYRDYLRRHKIEYKSLIV